MLLPQRDAVHDQVAEIDGVHFGKTCLVLFVDLDRLAVGELSGIVARHLIRRQRAILPALDDARQDAGRPFLVVDAFGLQQLLDQPGLVVGVEDGEIALESDQFGVPAQHAHADGVEGAEPHAVGRAADQMRDAVEHFARRLVGEGDGQDVRRPGAPGNQQMGDPRGQHARLAGAGAGQHQQRPTLVHDGLALLLVQTVEVGRRHDGAARRLWISRLGIVGDFKRIGGGRHAASYSNRGGRRLSFQ
jgi:hypothetical protein